MESYAKQQSRVFEELRTSDGQDDVVVYIKDQKVMKRLGPNWRVGATLTLTQSLSALFGQNNVKVVEKNVANMGKRY